VLDLALVSRLHARAHAERWDVTLERFAGALERAIAKEGDRLTPAALDRFIEALHLDDLALVVACADGHEAAWEYFLKTYQSELNRAAVAIAGGSHGQDLADALVADLFGLDQTGTGRRSLFEYFHGRSRLSTWLRALLARRHIDAVRARRRLSSLDALERPHEQFADNAPAPDPDHSRLTGAVQRCLDAALAALDARDRLRLACYHVDDMTLAQIGKLFGEHEATVSRKLQRIRQHLRERVDASLREELRLGPDEIRECYRRALEQGGLSASALKLVGARDERQPERARQESPADTF
jgi:RNA polymerase sigma-70 factor